MKRTVLFSRALMQPAALWCLFGFVLLVTAGGLALLSSQTLNLNRQQWQSLQREKLLQNLRVSLWRLDSRLGPFIATLQDPPFGINAQNGSDYVISRFVIKPAAGKSSTNRFVIAPWSAAGGLPVDERNDDFKRLVATIPVDPVVEAVEEMIPLIRVNPEQALVQTYFNPQSPDEASQIELGNRNAIVQQQVVMNAAPMMTKTGGTITAATPADDGAKLMSVWIDEQLIVVRYAAESAGELEGVWVDWPALSASLLEDVADLLPNAQLHRVDRSDTIDPSRTLAAIPAMLIPAQAAVTAPPWSPTHTALVFAWLALVASAVVAAVALSRLIALSERRASFVSAVTHELRTPLTTFRLYSDLLARDMVSDPDDRREYLQTLRREADRLTHLVDNVLRYSKLQRTSHQSALETVTLSDWIERITPRLSARLDAAEMTLVVEQQNDGPWTTDPPAMEQVVFNLIDNAAKYAVSASDRRVHLTIQVDNGWVVINVTDHGPGVPATLQSTIFKPFAKSAERAAETAAGVGLGLALARQTAMTFGGRLTYRDTSGGGASFRLEIPQT